LRRQVVEEEEDANKVVVGKERRGERVVQGQVRQRKERRLNQFSLRVVVLRRRMKNTMKRKKMRISPHAWFFISFDLFIFYNFNGLLFSSVVPRMGSGGRTIWTCTTGGTVLCFRGAQAVTRS